MKDGRLQRFCQQCGRFHDLSAFDGNRKSCREQLNKHNARRRRRAQLEQQAAAVPEDLSAIADEKSEVRLGPAFGAAWGLPLVAGHAPCASCLAWGCMRAATRAWPPSQPSQRADRC
jgi:predicted anti-sigma-YlaC factor YlaD